MTDNYIDSLPTEIKIKFIEEITNGVDKISFINTYFNEHFKDLNSLTIEDKIMIWKNYKMSVYKISMMEKILNAIKELEDFIKINPKFGVPLSITKRFDIHQHFINDLPKKTPENLQEYGPLFGIKKMCPEMEHTYLHYYIEILFGNKETSKHSFLHDTLAVYRNHKDCFHCLSQSRGFFWN